MTQEVQELGLAKVGLPFGYIAGDRNGYPSNLIRKTVNLPPGEILGDTIDLGD